MSSRSKRWAIKSSGRVGLVSLCHYWRVVTVTTGLYWVVSSAIWLVIILFGSHDALLFSSRVFGVVQGWHGVCVCVCVCLFVCLHVSVCTCVCTCTPLAAINTNYTHTCLCRRQSRNICWSWTACGWKMWRLASFTREWQSLCSTQTPLLERECVTQMQQHSVTLTQYTAWVVWGGG